MAEARFVDNGNGSWLLEGELGAASVPALLARATPALKGSGDIEVDLKGVTRADSAGLALLVELMRESSRNDRRIAFNHVPAQLLSIARVCGLEEILSLSK
jgi:phospholipid transport system transporter-binding protein